MSHKAKLQAEIARIKVTTDLANAALRIFATIRITQAKQPGIVMAACLDLETAIEQWAQLEDTVFDELEPLSGAPDP